MAKYTEPNEASISFTRVETEVVWCVINMLTDAYPYKICSDSPPRCNFQLGSLPEVMRAAILSLTELGHYLEETESGGTGVLAAVETALVAGDHWSTMKDCDRFRS